MKSWFNPSPTQNRARAWRFAKSLRDAQAYPWRAEEVALAEQFIAESLDAAAYRAAVYALTDWHNIKDRADFGGYSKAERDYRADIIATMEITIAQSEKK
ncbi:hypothetical protein LVJ82_05075 [Vitreoscilla massiliensis]|uniref:Uncharacterized protein n=1 Tax=Vitreoscilla massiliensis TaxID=1689272 RepID=A0ABY4E3J6_9NEIS|nr:hypothetical protein [Vitreoscilla massiliensis]UOO90356.1 hypothetical protein LVJ82_05075 [Vitreoscilla massiliensis]